MKSTLKQLMKEAEKSAKFRNHTMGKWHVFAGKKCVESVCTMCGAWVQVETNPAPNSIDIGGPAVAIGCPGTHNW
jgi:hypothetical protein